MRSFRRLAAYLAAGSAGVVGAHVVAYAAALPHAHQRAELLHATGHGYWPVATALALAATYGLIGLAVHAGTRRATGRAAFRDLSVGRLASFQVALFAGMEVVERLAAGAPVGELAHGAWFAVGLVVQVMVAALVCRLFGVVAAVAERVVAWRRRRRRTVAALPFRPASEVGFGPSGGSAPVGSRAPPSLLVT